MEDWDLLEQFRRERSEQAFGELVRRHGGFVLASCRRRLRDAHLAEDAAQAVFLALSRRPPVRSGSSALAGWLYQAAIYACNNAMRSKRRREKYERSAAVERGEAITAPRETGIDETLIDQALAGLSSKERDAVLLRFYQEKSVQQVGAALGISQNSATKRIGRAIEHLRQFFAAKGMTIAPAVVSESVSQALREPVSSEFIAQAVSIGLGKTSASSAIVQMADGVNHMFRVAKIKLVAATMFVIAVIASGLFGMSQLMAQDSKPQPVAVVRSEQPAQPAPAASPTSEPAGEAFDITTPTGALRAFAKATRSADYATIQKVALRNTDGEVESELVAAANEYQNAFSQLAAAVVAKYGETEARKFMRQRGAIPLEPFLRLIEAELDQHDVVVEGDVAKLVDRREPNTPTNIKLVREDGVWKIASSGLAAQFGEEVTARRLEALRRRAANVEAFAKEVAEGKFENIEAVGEALGEALRR